MDLLIFLIILGGGIYLYNKRKQRLQKLDYQFKSTPSRDQKDAYEMQVMPTIYTPLDILTIRGKKFKSLKRARREMQTSKFLNVNHLEYNSFDGVWSGVGMFYDKQELEQYYDFLEDIRMIVEDDSLSVDIKINDIIFTCKQKQHYKTYFQKLNEKYDSFPACLFYKKLTEVNGIGESTALDLFNSGFLSLGDLEKASTKELLEVPGVGNKTIKQIRNYFNNKVNLN